MKHFDTELDKQSSYRRVVEKEIVQEVKPEPQIKQSFVAPSNSQTHAFSHPEQWNWEQLRDYVVSQIEQRFGAFPRDPVVEASIFRSFYGRWKEKSGLIAVAAFEAHGGYWRSAPITVSRFTKGSDDYFASIIASNISA